MSRTPERAGLPSGGGDGQPTERKDRVGIDLEPEHAGGMHAEREHAEREHAAREHEARERAELEHAVQEHAAREHAAHGPSPYLAIVGATGTGKSDLGVDVAVALREEGVRAEIVGADAMQLYRGMDIGTAKLSTQERRGIPHHLLDVLEVTEEATVAWYQPRAREAIADIRGRGALPILVGGSGLYVSSVLYDFAFPGRDAELRARLEFEAASSGIGPLLDRLRTLDPVTADRVDVANTRRVIRALEVAELRETGHGASLPERPVEWSPVTVVGLGAQRNVLVDRLDLRVRRMWESGLLDEVRGLLAQGLERGTTASRAIGYVQAAAQLRGELTEDDAIAETQRLTRRYARRQVSWFKRYPGLHWLDASDRGEEDRARIVAAVLDRLAR
ncbi:tRNA (adenosine(37)-N6)-dimethylallyltransferase MiaA [Humibacter sp.]|uniref:tRNA (adenosine(37)-N6)-dimethylallyltransferase MiaA n=1 Tax=Humibacter sp. TaxID=1940291 RepID=UPI002B63ABD9|nr:tRNA (adenosine(37)-N6)-dimethylallyltransferase MiaA [Humibacter sp.]HVX06329.1 tRNA (adenosine(37)-N6)-dimethylallyltransferase MiaA [Humibacter sp.]